MIATVPRTPLDGWIASQLNQTPGSLTREAITQYQLGKLRETVRMARERSPFYAKHLCTVDESSLRSLDDLRRIPFTTSEDISHSAAQFLCVSQSEICRIVTLTTSGTSGEPKRLYFTAADQERSLEFFAHGVSTLATPGDAMLIALPGVRQGSVGNLLAQGLQRFGVRPIPFDLIASPTDALQTMEREQATCIIGFPVQILSLASEHGTLADRVFSRLRSVVLCSDHVSPAIVRRLQQRAHCKVFEHYGSTEMGFGGGVDCAAHTGYHLREADFLFEIVDPATGEPVPDGQMGEIVFSSLTREGMPLIRYRTGDLSRFIAQPCECGTQLKTLQHVSNRVDGFVSLGKCGEISMADLDNVMFEIPGVLDFTATLTLGPVADLRIAAHVYDLGKSPVADRASALLKDGIAAIRTGCASGELRMRVDLIAEQPAFTGAKRRIEVHTGQ